MPVLLVDEIPSHDFADVEEPIVGTPFATGHKTAIGARRGSRPAPHGRFRERSPYRRAALQHQKKPGARQVVIGSVPSAIAAFAVCKRAGRSRRAGSNLPVRMLLIGMPSTIVLGALVALVLPLGLSLWGTSALECLLSGAKQTYRQHGPNVAV